MSHLVPSNLALLVCLLPVLPLFASEPRRPQVEEMLGRLPLRFEENRGQGPAGARFIASNANWSLYLGANRSELAVRGPLGTEVLSFGPAGAAGPLKPEPLAPLPTLSSYFPNSDPRTWITAVPNYSRVRYRGVYPGVDLVYYGRQGRLEYDFVIHPGASPDNVRLRFHGHGGLRLDADGNLHISLAGLDVVQRKPVVFQPAVTGPRPVAGRFVLLSQNEVGFEVGEYDRRRALVIDPVLEWSTLFGNGFQAVRDLAVDSHGNVFIAGQHRGLVYPTAPGSLRQDGNTFVAKLNPSGTQLLYSATIGSSGGATAVAVDAAGRAFVAGEAAAEDSLPTTGNAFQPKHGGSYSDGTFMVLSASGDALEYATYIGGSAYEEVFGLALSPGGEVIIVGQTGSADFPVIPGGVYPRMTGSPPDAFVIKFNKSLQPVYSTFLGGSRSEWAHAVAADAEGNAYVVGVTTSNDFPVTAGAAQTKYANSDAFIAKLTPKGDKIAYASYIGGKGSEDATGVVVDDSGAAFVAGDTDSADFPATAGAWRISLTPGATAQGQQTADAFAVKLAPDGSRFEYATYIGGSNNERRPDCALDKNGRLAVSGPTWSTDFPVSPDAVQPAFGGGFFDFFVALLNASGAGVPFASYIGGSGWEDEGGVEFGPDGAIVAAGYTSSANFPTTTGVYQQRMQGAEASFVWKISAVAPPAGPRVAANGVVNAASYQGGGVAPGEIVTIWGSDLGPATLAGYRLSADGSRFLTETAGSRALFDGVPGPMIYAAAGVVSTVVPYSVAGQTAVSVVVECNGTPSLPVNVPVVAAVPGIFTAGSVGTGQAAALHWPDYSVNSAANPVKRGGVIMVYATSGGLTDPLAQDGEIVPGAQPMVLPVTATIGGLPAEVSYAGSAPTLVAGVLQVNIVVPENAPTGAAVPLSIRAGDAVAQADVTIAVTD